MKIEIEIGDPQYEERKMELIIKPDDLSAILLNIASPMDRNRSEYYLRRHPLGPNDQVCANNPHRDPREPKKISIPDHIQWMRSTGKIPAAPAQSTNEQNFELRPAMFVIPISDLTSNLLRPCCHKDGLGKNRLFFFKHEPITMRQYWCACYYAGMKNTVSLEMNWVRFDPQKDTVTDLSGQDLFEKGLIWAAALTPLVTPQTGALSSIDIARNDYDLRQIIGRDADTALQYAYQGCFKEWDKRVSEVVSTHSDSGKPFALFYHSILAIDRHGNIRIFQMEGTLPELADMLEKEGIHSAGVLDSGGSCGLYDVWMESYINHSWYFRELRGSILVLMTKWNQRLPLRGDSWFKSRKEN